MRLVLVLLCVVVWPWVLPSFVVKARLVVVVVVGEAHFLASRYGGLKNRLFRLCVARRITTVVRSHEQMCEMKMKSNNQRKITPNP